MKSIQNTKYPRLNCPDSYNPTVHLLLSIAISTDNALSVPAVNKKPSHPLCASQPACFLR